MKKRFKLVVVDSVYCDYLRKYDEKVPYNFSKKENRPFVGVLFNIDELEYFAPLGSPKEKHKLMRNMVDFIKIDDGNLGVINFNNMIPLTCKNYKLLDMDHPNNIGDKRYFSLLLEQIVWLNENASLVRKKSKRLRMLYISKKLNKSIASRCCNFKLLEEKCKEYNEKHINVGV